MPAASIVVFKQPGSTIMVSFPVRLPGEAVCAECCRMYADLLKMHIVDAGPGAAREHAQRFKQVLALAFWRLAPPTGHISCSQPALNAKALGSATRPGSAFTGSEMQMVPPPLPPGLLPDVQPSHFDSYIRDLGNRYDRFEELRRSLEVSPEHARPH